MPQQKKKNKRRMTISPTDASSVRMARAGSPDKMEKKVMAASAKGPFAGTKTLDLLDMLQGDNLLSLEDMLAILTGKKSLPDIDPSLR